MCGSCSFVQVTAATAVSGTSVTTGGGTITVAGLGFGPVGSQFIQYIFWDKGPGGTFQTLYPLDTAIAATVSVQNTQITFNAPTGTGSVSQNRKPRT